MEEKKHQLIKIKMRDYKLIKELAEKEDRTIQGVVANLLKQSKGK